MSGNKTFESVYEPYLGDERRRCTATECGGKVYDDPLLKGADFCSKCEAQYRQEMESHEIHGGNCKCVGCEDQRAARAIWEANQYGSTSSIPTERLTVLGEAIAPFRVRVDGDRELFLEKWMKSWSFRRDAIESLHHMIEFKEGKWSSTLAHLESPTVANGYSDGWNLVPGHWQPHFKDGGPMDPDNPIPVHHIWRCAKNDGAGTLCGKRAFVTRVDISRHRENFLTVFMCPEHGPMMPPPGLAVPKRI